MKTIEVKNGSVTVKIHHTPVDSYDAYTVSFYARSNESKRPKRMRKVFASLEKARAFAEAQADQLAEGRTDEAVTGDRAVLLSRAEAALAPHGLSIDAAAVEFAAAHALLRGKTTVLQAAREWVDRRCAVQPMTCAAVLDEMLTRKQAAGRGKHHLKGIKWQIRVFCQTFGDRLIESVTGRQIDDWLVGLRRRDGKPKPISGRSRNNYRSEVKTFFRYAKGRKYLPNDWNEMTAVEKTKERKAKIGIFQPEEISQILNGLLTLRPALVPCIAIGAFAGMRTEEIQELDWAEINWDENYILAAADKNKTASNRHAPMSEQLRKWIEPFRQTSGRISPFVQLGKMSIWAKRTGVKWKVNGLRHSYISYRYAITKDKKLVAWECGTSEKKIDANYCEPVSLIKAAAWFQICHNSVINVIPISGILNKEASE